MRGGVSEFGPNLLHPPQLKFRSRREKEEIVVVELENEDGIGKRRLEDEECEKTVMKLENLKR